MHTVKPWRLKPEHGTGNKTTSTLGCIDLQIYNRSHHRNFLTKSALIQSTDLMKWTFYVEMIRNCRTTNNTVLSIDTINIFHLALNIA